MGWLASWWDSVELWLTGLPFVAQLPIVLVVLVPLCFLVAVVVDRAADLVAARFRWRTTRVERGAPDTSADASAAPPRD